MHILVISNIPNGVDPIVDSLSHEDIGLVAKEIDFDNETLVSIVSDYLSKKDFDLIIILPKDPVGVNMALNKHPKITAALCESEEDVHAASRNNANTIILKRSGSRMLEMLNALFSESMDTTRGEGRSAHPPEKQVKEGRKSISHIINKHAQRISKSIGLGKKQGEHAERKEQEAEQIKYTRKGIFGRLKDELGIVDDK